MDIAIQLYSLRRITNKDTINDVLSFVHSCGFTAVEPYCNDYGIGFDKTAEIIAKNGLKCKSIHLPQSVLTNKQELKRLKDILNFDIAVLPSLPKEIFYDEKALSPLFGKICDNTGELGLTFAYHNHNFEFDGGSDAYFNSLPAKYGIKFEPDVYWLSAAGINPISWLNANGKNVELIHLKEYGGSLDRNDPVVGSGVTGAAEVIKYAKAHDHRTIVLEFENPGIDEKSYAEQSVKFIKEALNG